MSKAQSEKEIRVLVHEWAQETSFDRDSGAMPSFSTFSEWLTAKGKGHLLNFRSVRGSLEDAEQWFDEELKQGWRN